jgi:hypothetical protein
MKQQNSGEDFFYTIDSVHWKPKKLEFEPQAPGIILPMNPVRDFQRGFHEFTTRTIKTAIGYALSGALPKSTFQYYIAPGLAPITLRKFTLSVFIADVRWHWPKPTITEVLHISLTRTDTLSDSSYYDIILLNYSGVNSHALMSQYMELYKSLCDTYELYEPYKL